MNNPSRPPDFSKAIDFLEVPDKSRPLGAFAVLVDSSGNAWAFDGDSPRPISPDELKAKGAFCCKPEDAAELMPNFGS